MSLRGYINAGKNTFLGLINLIQTDPELKEHLTSATLLISSMVEILDLLDKYLKKRSSPQETAYCLFLQYILSSARDIVKDLAHKDDRLKYSKIVNPKKIQGVMLSAYYEPEAWNSYLPDNSVVNSFLNVVLDCLKDNNVSCQLRDEFYNRLKLKLENANRVIELTEFFEYCAYVKQHYTLIQYLSHVEELRNEAQDVDKKPLKDYYIPLHAAYLQTAEAFNMVDSQIRNSNTDIHNVQEVISSLLPNEPYIIVAAPFGVGKTSLCKMIASQYASDYLDSNLDLHNSQYIPVFVSLKDGLSVDYNYYSLDNILKKVITSEQIAGSMQRHILLILNIL